MKRPLLLIPIVLFAIPLFYGFSEITTGIKALILFNLIPFIIFINAITYVENENSNVFWHKNEYLAVKNIVYIIAHIYFFHSLYFTAISLSKHAGYVPFKLIILYLIFQLVFVYFFLFKFSLKQKIILLITPMLLLFTWNYFTFKYVGFRDEIGFLSNSDLYGYNLWFLVTYTLVLLFKERNDSD